ncbi:MAG: YggT family protein [Elusimicrobia bacterium]|nr:YggT family protein [Elusimicrobiota bacterium]
MFVLSNLLMAFARLADVILTAVYWLVLARAILSWVNPDPYNPLVRFLYRTTEPLLRPVRERLPVTGIDVSPIIVFLAVMFLRIFLVQTIADIALRLR